MNQSKADTLRAGFFAVKLARVVPVTLKSKPGVELFAKVFTGADRNALVAAQPENMQGDSPDARSKQFEAQLALIVRGICDDEGAPLFTDADLPLLTDEPAAVLDEMAQAVMTTNGMGAKAAESIEKN